MKKRLFFCMVLSVLIFLVGCEDKRTDPIIIPTEAIQATKESTSVETPKSVKASTPMDKYEVLKTKELSAQAINAFLEENVNSMNSVLSTTVINDFIFYQRSALNSETEVFYREDMIGIHQAIDQAVKKLESTVTGPLLIGPNRAKILEAIQDEKYHKVIKNCFDQGLGLMNGEGSYYPIVDYYALNVHYSQVVSDDMKVFLEMTALDVEKPLTVEEYLAVSPKELGERAVAYERYLKNYSDGLYRDEIRNNLMVSIWKLVNPNPFDGMLLEDFTISPDLKLVYADLLKAEDTPVIQACVKGILTFAERKNGVLGTLDNMDALMEVSFALHEKASEQIKALYKIEEFK